ncbi:MAG: sulfatase [Bacteroidales bacterium]|nr:sulfatase [Bacteroidales bacterium]
MKRKDFLKYSVLGSAAYFIGASSYASAKGKKPNILFIICDDLNDAVTGFGGHKQAKTPNLDRIVKLGVRFTNAEVNSPVSGPSRASFLTGLYPHTSGYFGFNFNKDHWRFNPTLKHSVTFLDFFKKNGYKVMGTGKIFHNSQEEWEVWDDFGAKPSWGPWPWDGTPDTEYSFGQLNPWGNASVHQDFADKYGIGDQFGPLGNVPKIPPHPENGIPGYEGWRLYHKPFRYVNDEDRDLMPDELNAKWASERLRESHDQPFMMCIGMNRPHEPMFAPQEYFDMFPLDQVELAPVKEDDLDDCAKVLTRPPAQVGLYGHRRYQYYIETGGVAFLRRWTQAYLANIAFVDAQIGKVLDALEKSEYAENTYVFFTSDNGYHMGEKQYLFKNSVWEESCRVPFIVTGPGVKPGAVCSQPVSLVDLYPTFMDLCNITGEPNRGTNHKMLDGFSIKPFLKDPENGRWAGPDAALSAVASVDRLELGEPGKAERQHYSLRTRRYRYVYCNNGEEELYDHDTDPYEWDNLVFDSNHDMLRRELHEKLMWMLR